MSIYIVVIARPRPQRRAALVAAIERAAAEFHTENGCELFTLLENDEQIVLIEKWANQKTLDAHLAGDALRVLFQAIAGLVIGAPAVHTLAAHPLGTAGAGRI